MRRTLLAILIICPCLVFSQGWVNNGAQIVLKNDVNVVITTGNGNYLNKGDGQILSNGGSHFLIRGDWTNNGNTLAIASNDGEVILDGDIQRINGTASTEFNTLTLKGTNDKYLDVDALVGGGQAGTKTGILDLGVQNLFMPSRKLIVNNPSTNGIGTNTGLLIGETNSLLGYSNVQWNVRNSAAGSAYIVPFGTTDFIAIPFSAILSSQGVQSADSGRIIFATYPTLTATAPNNRPLPTGAVNLDNKYGIENDIKTVDRFYVVDLQGYSTKPSGNLDFPYVDREWDMSGGSTNDIDETALKAAQLLPNTSVWNYDIDAVTSTAANVTSADAVSDFSGAWVLHNVPPCPTAFFKSFDDCMRMGITATDSSYIESGTIDSTVWFSEGRLTSNSNTFFNIYSAEGNYTIQRKVRSDRGCWDSLTLGVEVFPHPVSKFRHSDTCLNDLTFIESTSTTSSGSPITNDWVIEGLSIPGNSTYYTFSDTGAKIITLYSMNAWGCLDTLIQPLIIEPLPEVSFTFSDICEGEIANFVSTSQTKGVMEEDRWSVNEIVTSFNPNYNQVLNLRGTYDIELRNRNSFGCLDSLTMPIIVKPKAVANFTVFPDEIFITDPYVNFVENSLFSTTWEWELGDNSPTEFGPDVFHIYGDTGVFSIRLIANNDDNCGDTIFKTIRIKPFLRIYIPNAFRPGGEVGELNSTFAPAGMLYGLKEMTMTIYNRWGEQLYYSEDINLPWDGTYLGKPVQEGSYLYMITLKDIYNQIAWHQGTVMVIH